MTLRDRERNLFVSSPLRGKVFRSFLAMLLSRMNGIEELDP